MRRRVYLGLVSVVCSLAWLLALPLAAPAQVSFVEGSVSTAAIAPSAATPIDGVLERGKQLESQRRWGEALSLYEDAIRSHPQERILSQRFSLARTHYDLARRYSDTSFRDSLTALSFREALDLYAEVLGKIQTHYVEAPDWNALVSHGTAGLESALTDPIFVERNLPGVAASRIEYFKRQLRDYLASRNAGRVATRQAARDLVALAAQFSHDQLGLLETAVVLEYVSGATNALDQYSTYLTAGQLNEVYSQIEGNFVGLGVELKANDGALLIVKVITGSPAERGGIHAGDRIVAVDGRSTSSMNTDQAANMLQGKEGTVVDVTAVSPGQRPRVLRIRREQVEVPSIDGARIVDAAYGVAYLKLTCFQKTTSRDLDTALWKLHREGMRSLIIDLRGNPGGLLTTSVDVVDKFVDAGVIVSTRGRSPQEDYNYSARQAGTWRVPLVVLIDGDSASASEIFAGAIRDHHRGVIVGTRSYGKGSVQGIFPLNLANSGLRLTTAKFYSPRGLAYSQVGVSPDLLVQQTAKPVVGDDVAEVAPAPGEPDPVFDAGVREARRQVARR
ncbi:MAG TPA: S41 family peptidase [Pirellulales bacterium]|nr:S41 family peptidase [Pirellulales bacterium]